MEPVARYHDGLVAEVRAVTFALTQGQPAELIVADEATRDEIDRWPAADVFEVPGRPDELRLGATGRPYGARLIVADAKWIAALRRALPALPQRLKQERGQQRKVLGVAVGALLSVIVAYVVGVPLLASSISGLVPPAWETRLGDGARVQIEAMLGSGAGFQRCDYDPSSTANLAIARFAAEVMQDSGSPFTPQVTMVRSALPNAFALPGGQTFYFSALLDRTETADEFAGVLAHELGHVANRHGMEGLIANSATGLLVGFVLGDMTNLSIAAAIGATLIDSRFSREAEREADRFAATAGSRLGFSPAALARLLNRVAADDGMSQSLALLSTHPLTDERRAALEALAAEPAAGVRPFTDAEWSAIKAMCRPPAAGALGAAGIVDRGTAGVVDRGTPPPGF